MSQLLPLLILALGIWFWLDSVRTKELATEICSYACRHRNFQFLDDTVGLVRVGIKRDAQGRLRIRRWYRFDYSVEGVGRCTGNAFMLGLDLEAIELYTPPAVDIGQDLD